MVRTIQSVLERWREGQVNCVAGPGVCKVGLEDISRCKEGCWRSFKISSDFDVNVY